MRFTKADIIVRVNVLSHELLELHGYIFNDEYGQTIGVAKYMGKWYLFDIHTGVCISNMLGSKRRKQCVDAYMANFEIRSQYLQVQYEDSYKRLRTEYNKLLEEYA